MPRRKPNRRIPSTPLPRNPDRLMQQIRAHALPPIPQPHSPRAHHTLATPQAVRAVVLIPAAARRARGQHAVGLEPQHQRADDLAAVPRAQHDVLGAAVAVREEVVPQLLGEREVARRREADRREVRHERARGQRHTQAPVGGAGAACELVHEGEDGGERCQWQRVEDDGARGALALLSDGIGDELEGVDFVGTRGKDVEGEWRNVVEGVAGWELVVGGFGLRWSGGPGGGGGCVAGEGGWPEGEACLGLEERC